MESICYGINLIGVPEEVSVGTVQLQYCINLADIMEFILM